MIKAEIFEVEYSVSPGGVDCWEMEIRSYGETKNYSDYKTAGAALDHLLSIYPKEEIELSVTSLEAYNVLTELENV